jgi:hypothetical protein
MRSLALPMTQPTRFTRLDALPREQALEIIYDTLGRSNRLYEAAERQRTEQEERNNASLDRNYRGMFMFADRTKEFTVADLMQVAPSVAAVSGLLLHPTRRSRQTRRAKRL